MKIILQPTFNFSKYCSLINIISKTPPAIPHKSDKFLPNNTFSDKDNRKITRSVNPN